MLLIIGLTVGIRGTLAAGLSAGLLSGLSSGLCGAMYGGGTFAIRHFVLRGVLWSSRLAPWDYAAFLDFASERVLLHKVGGGYKFTHRMLQEYFASLRTPGAI
jgi:hypothetical protein